MNDRTEDHTYDGKYTVPLVLTISFVYTSGKPTLPETEIKNHTVTNNTLHTQTRSYTKV